MAAMSLCGVTAHGSPSGPLQFGRLEAALAAWFRRNAIPRLSGRSALDGSIIRKEASCQTTPIKERPSFTISPRTLIARQLCIMARKIIRLRTNTRKRRWNTRIRLTNGQKKRSRNQPIPPFEMTCPRYFSHLIRAVWVGTLKPSPRSASVLAFQ
jgi:hypothetical protein